VTATARDAAPSRQTEAALGKAGWAARGVLYSVTALLATRIASGGGGGEDASQTGALRTIAEQPFGKALLGALAVGLVAFAGWRFLQAWRHDDDEAMQRLGHLGSGVIYLVLGVSAAAMVLGGGSGGSGGSGGGGGGDQQAQGVTADVLSWPVGPWLVGAVGLGIIAVGVVFLKRGIGRDFMDDLQLGRLSRRGQQAVEALGVFGQCARGAVFGLIGWFVVRAAVEFDPQEARGLDGALRELAQATYGKALLWAAALGLLAYGLFCLVRARYDRTT
jgi:hypothetical protein